MKQFDPNSGTARDWDEIGNIPMEPGIYAFYSGVPRSRHVVYVGCAGTLRNRVSRHLEYRGSSVAAGATAASMNPDLITDVHYWMHPFFTDRVKREAAELVAFDKLTPVIRSRARVAAVSLVQSKDKDFRSEMERLFSGEPSGTAKFHSVTNAMRRIKALEDLISGLVERVKALEEK